MAATELSFGAALMRGVWLLGRVDVFVIAGLDLWFNSHDHGPPHFHARRPGEWEIRVYFLSSTEERLDFEVRWGREPPGAYVRTLTEHVTTGRAELLNEWEQKVCQ